MESYHPSLIHTRNHQAQASTALIPPVGATKALTLLGGTIIVYVCELKLNNLKPPRKSTTQTLQEFTPKTLLLEGKNHETNSKQINYYKIEITIFSQVNT